MLYKGSNKDEICLKMDSGWMKREMGADSLGTLAKVCRSLEGSSSSASAYPSKVR